MLTQQILERRKNFYALKQSEVNCYSSITQRYRLVDLRTEDNNATRSLVQKSCRHTVICWMHHCLLCLGFGAILLDSTGKRFVNELAPRDVVTAAILTHGKPASQWPMMTQNKMMENSVEPTAVLLLMNQNIRNK